MVIVARRPIGYFNSGRINMARFEVGDHAPDFSAITHDGNTIRLADFLGKRALVLFFYQDRLRQS